jgi:mannitol-1-/sugar-/sorbitol-6-phosphatase
VLFDMDGTLVDSGSTVELAWTELAQRYGLDAAELLALIHGVRAADTIDRHLPPEVQAEALAWLEEREIGLARGSVEIPGAVEYVTQLVGRGIPVAVVTSATAPLARARLEAAGLTVPEVLVSAELVAHGKPAPDGYRLAAERLGVDPADCVVFEDAEAGIRAGLAAGARVVVVGADTSSATDGLTRIADYRGLAGTAADPFASAS